MKQCSNTVAVIGGGRWGQNIIRTLHQLNVLSAIAEANPETQEVLAIQYPNVPIYSDYQALLASTIPAVAIATPVITHEKIAMAALAAGKDTFVEKPLAMTSNGCQQLIDNAQKANCILMVGHMLMYRAAVTFIKEYISSGKLGKIYSLWQVRRNLGTIRTEENALYSLGVHDVAVLDYLIASDVENIQVTGQSIITPNIHDDIHLELMYQNGVGAHLHVSWLWPYKERKLLILGEKGALEFDELTSEVVYYENYGNSDASVTNNGETVIFTGESEPLTTEMQHFLSCIETREKPLSDGEQGKRVVSILEQATRQLQSF